MHIFTIAGQDFSSNALTDDELAKDVLNIIEKKYAQDVTLYVKGSSYSFEKNASVNFSAFVESLISHAAESKSFFLGLPKGDKADGFLEGIKFYDSSNVELVFAKGCIVIEGKFSKNRDKVSLDLENAPGY